MNELKRGYKQTEVGVIPEDWEVKRLGEIASVSAGGTPSRTNPSYWNGTIPWVTTSEVDGCRIRHAEQSITKAGLDSSAAKMLSPGTLLMALYGQGKTRGKVGILEIAAATNQACAAISLNREVNRDFIFHRLASQYEAIRKLSNTGNQENLNGSIVRAIEIPLPPFAEQRAIAGVLGDVDALIGALDRLIAKKRDLKQAAMQQLLTGQNRLPGLNSKLGYKQSDLGMIPTDWEVKRLGDVLAATRLGGNYANQASETRYPLMKMGNIGRGNFDLQKIEYVAHGVVPDESHRLRLNDVLFNTRNTLDLVGKVAIWKNQLPVAYYNSNLLRLDFHERDVGSHQYANYALNTKASVDRLRMLATGTTSVAAIYSRDLFGFPFLVPPVGEQRAIAGVLEDMDAEIASLEKRRDKTRLLKQGMMQELLTGRIRLS